MSGTHGAWLGTHQVSLFVYMLHFDCLVQSQERLSHIKARIYENAHVRNIIVHYGQIFGISYLLNFMSLYIYNTQTFL